MISCKAVWCLGSYFTIDRKVVFMYVEVWGFGKYLRKKFFGGTIILQVLSSGVEGLRPPAAPPAAWILMSVVTVQTSH